MSAVAVYLSNAVQVST